MTKLSMEKSRPYLMIMAGCLVMTAAMNIFLIPFKLAPGGVSGLSTVIYYLINGAIPVGTLMLFFNIPLFVAGFKSKGRRFIQRSLFGTVILSIMIDLSAPFTDKLLKVHLVGFDSAMAIPDLLLNGLLGGAIMGLGLGMVLKEDATTGGTDLAASIMRKFMRKLSMGELILIFDGSVILFATIAFRSVKLGLYAGISLYIASKTIDAYIEGFHFGKSLMIISKCPDIIASRLMHDVDRGVTGLKGMGMYSKENKTVLLCVVKKQEISIVKDIVKECDPEAFVLLSDVREVLGEGFDPLHPSDK